MAAGLNNFHDIVLFVESDVENSGKLTSPEPAHCLSLENYDLQKVYCSWLYKITSQR